MNALELFIKYVRKQVGWQNIHFCISLNFILFHVTNQRYSKIVFVIIYEMDSHQKLLNWIGFQKTLWLSNWGCQFDWVPLIVEGYPLPQSHPSRILFYKGNTENCFSGIKLWPTFHNKLGILFNKTKKFFNAHFIFNCHNSKPGPKLKTFLRPLKIFLHL